MASVFREYNGNRLDSEFTPFARDNMKSLLAFLFALLCGLTSSAIPDSSLQAACQWQPRLPKTKQAETFDWLGFSVSDSSNSSIEWFDDAGKSDPETHSRSELSSSKNHDALLGARRTLDHLQALETQATHVLERSTAAIVSLEGGSGVIVSPDGHILTASHVARKTGTQIQVKLSDGTSWVGVTIGSDIVSDSAIVKLLGSRQWPSIPIGNSLDVAPGQWVIGMGYPLSFSSGRPAAVRLGRILRTSDTRLVSDCVIMGGDSGGPLMDLAGNLIGINSRIKKDIDENYFVPSEVIQTRWRDLLRLEKVDSKLSRQHPLPQSGMTTDSALGELEWDRNASPIGQALEFLYRDRASSMVRVNDGKRSVAGTIVSADGLVVAKLSEIKKFDAGDALTISTATQTRHCQIVAESNASDLVLLQWTNEAGVTLAPGEGQAISFPTNVARQTAGSLVFSPTQSKPWQLGVVAVEDQVFSYAKLANETDLGVIVRQLKYIALRDPNGIRSTHPAVEIDRVYPDSLADQAGLKVGDLLMTLDGRPIYQQREIAAIAANASLGQTLRVKIVTGGRVEDRSIVIPVKDQPDIFERWGGGPFSKRRFGIGPVICHDGIIKPEDCGGPLFDLQGNVIGINIARATRVSTFAIPLDVVKTFVLQHRPDAKLVFQR